MNYLCVCSGITAATVAWSPMGWKPVAFAEIDKFPSAVLAHHWPHVPNLGDFTEIKTDDLAEPIDVLVGGTPCQSFSIAGLRGGMADDRGNLALEFLRLAARTRPRWIVWENVPGVLSSNGGRDFGTFLGGLGQLGYGFAYRVLDAQFVRVQSHAFAVPQRRRRVFVVGYLGDWRRAAQVLIERESMCGNPPPRREAGQNVTGTLSSRTSAGGGLGTDFDIAGGLVAHTLKGEGFDASEDGTGRGVPLVSHTLNCAPHGKALHNQTLVSRTLMASDKAKLDPEFETFIIADASTGSFWSSDVAASMTTGTDKTRSMPLVAGNRTQRGPFGVRRLTPRECERLQGFPDDYTAVTYRNKPACDGPRYKALGNSMAANVMRWLGERIQAVEATS